MDQREIEEIILCEGYKEYDDMWFAEKPFRRIVIGGFTKERDIYLHREYFSIGNVGYLTGEWQVIPDGQPINLIKQLAFEKMQSSISKRNHLKLIDWLGKQNEKTN